MLERVLVDEAYCVSVSSADLRVHADRRGDVDCLIAVGWSHSRVGALLLRLHTEWDALGYQVVTGRHAHVQERIAGLRSYAQACTQVAAFMAASGVVGAQGKARAIVVWWLRQVCPSCNGTKFEPILGTGRLSAKVCKTCCGSGLVRVPCGEDGRKAANWMDDCVNAARASIGKRLRSLQNRV